MFKNLKNIYNIKINANKLNFKRRKYNQRKNSS